MEKQATATTIPIHIGGKEFSAPLETIPLAKLHLDKDNVRFRHQEVRMKDKEIQDFIWQEYPDTHNLYDQIIQAGGLIDPPVVKPEQGGNFTVIEGNRRIACLRKLNEEGKKGQLEEVKLGRFAADHFENVVCAVLPTDISKKDIDTYLGSIHVVGKKKWAANNKAALIWDLDGGKHNLTQDQISRALGIGKAMVNRMIQAYKYTTDYGKKYPKDDWLGRYSYFDELIKKKKEYPDDFIERLSAKEVKLREGGVEKIMMWVHEGRIPRGERMRDLPGILADPDARKVFEAEKVGQAFEKGMEVLKGKYPTEYSSVYVAIQRATDALRNIKLSEFEEMQEDDARVRMLETLDEEAQKILRRVNK